MQFSCFKWLQYQVLKSSYVKRGTELKINEEWMNQLRPLDDIFLTCVHEAAHLVILRHYGGDGHIHIFPTIVGEEDHDVGEPQVSGRVVVAIQPIGDPWRSSIMFGLSGMCGELLFRHENPAWLWQDLIDSWENHSDLWSASDIALATCQGEYQLVLEDFEECAELIYQEREQIRLLALEAYQKAIGVSY